MTKNQIKEMQENIKKDFIRQVEKVLDNEPYGKVKMIIKSIHYLETLKTSYSFTHAFLLKIYDEKHLFLLSTGLHGDLLKIPEAPCTFYYKETVVKR